MAKMKAKSRGKSRKTSASRTRRGRQGQDAIELLKADHRQVETWFEQFKSGRATAKKERLATMICEALRAHTTIEEEIFYPAFLEATGDEEMHHEAEIEHDAAKKLIAEIESSDSGDDFFEARVKVLAEMIRHHVNEEEKRDGLFARARRAEMDLEELGRQMSARKAQLMPSGGSGRGARTDAGMTAPA